MAAQGAEGMTRPDEGSHVARLLDAFVDRINHEHPDAATEIAGRPTTMWFESAPDGTLVMALYADGRRVLSIPAAEMRVREITQWTVSPGRSFVWRDDVGDRVLSQPDPRPFRAASN